MNSLFEKLKRNISKDYRRKIKGLVYPVRYYGNRYYCPLCKSRTRLQLPLGYDFDVIREKKIIGAGVRTALCPVCNSSDRIRLLYLFLTKHTRLFSESTSLLHFAPEPSLEHIIRKHKHIKYLTADLYEEEVMEKIDITDIPYPDGTFTAILCNHVLEHIPDDAKAMEELYRVLAPGGWAVLQVPISGVLEQTYEDNTVVSQEERELKFGQKDHVRIYGQDYSNRLKDAGFIVEPFRWTEDNDPVFQDPSLNLDKEETVFYCRK